MEQSTDALQVFYRKIGLVNLNQVVGYCMVKEVDILLNLIYLIDILFIQGNKSVHRAIQVLACKLTHSLNFLNNLDNSCCGIKYHLITDILKCIDLPVANLLILTGYKKVGHLNDE